MMKYSSAQDRMVMTIVGLLAIVVVLSAAPHLAYRVSCGSFPVFDPLSSVKIFMGVEASELWPVHDQNCIPSRPVLIGSVIAATVLLIVIALIVATKYANYRRTSKYFIRQMYKRPEFANRRDIIGDVGDKAVMKRGLQVRPSLVMPSRFARLLGIRPSWSAADVAWKLGAFYATAVWISLEDAMLLIGPPRSGKGFMILMSAIIEAPGAVVTTSTRGDNMIHTIKARSKVGPVYVFDPELVTNRTTTVRWSPISGCEDGRIAERRAAVLVSGTGLKADGHNAPFATKATSLLKYLMHAAAQGGVSLKDLHRWTKDPHAAKVEAVAILEKECALRGCRCGWGGYLLSQLEESSQLVENKWFGVDSSLTALDDPATLELFEPSTQYPMFDPEQFLQERGTLYMIAEPPSSQPGTSAGIGVFFSMILDDIKEAVHTISQQTVAGRLDPPVSFILDELANIHPWAGLPSAMSAGSGEGLHVVAVFQSQNQIRAGWGQEGAGTIWESATSKVLLGGQADPSDLRAVVDLLGQTQELSATRSGGTGKDDSWSEQYRDRPLISVDELRRLPLRYALFMFGRSRPMLVDLIPWTERPWSKDVLESRKWHEGNPAGTRTHPGSTYTAQPKRTSVLS